MARRPTRVKNKAAAPIQITAEQILREARERQEPAIRPPKQKITDQSELDDYRSQTRKKFEDQIRRFRTNASVWVKYAQWEEKQKDFARTRSIWERALEADYKNHTLWLKYAEFEMTNRFLNSARNVWDKAVSLLPRVDQLWFKYAHMEEVLGNVAAARQVFERWMMWRPDTQAWLSYINFENRYGETERAQRIFNRFILCHPQPEPNFEFEKQDGDKEDEIIAKRRSQYEKEVRKNPMNYDYWFDYIHMEEGVGNRDVNVIRDVYERAIANVPPREEKRYWVRYIYLWINYALFEELEAEDFNRTRDVYKKCLELIPHKKFSFAKIWLLAAQFEIRQKNLKTVRQILGNAIGKAPKSKIFKRYIDIELQLGNLYRCRILYQKYLEWNPANCFAWIKYAEFERSYCETERAQAIYELAIDQPVLDKPELLWKAFINFEISQNEFDLVRQLYERLLQRTKSLDVNRKRAVTDEVALAPNLKILEAAYKWKKQKVGSDEE